MLFYPFPILTCVCFPLLTVLDTAAGVWLDRNGLVTSSRTSKGHDYDPSLELMRRCRHAAAAVGAHIYIYGGLRGGKDSKNTIERCYSHRLRAYFDTDSQIWQIQLLVINWSD